MLAASGLGRSSRGDMVAEAVREGLLPIGGVTSGEGGSLASSMFTLSDANVTEKRDEEEAWREASAGGFADPLLERAADSFRSEASLGAVPLSMSFLGFIVGVNGNG